MRPLTDEDILKDIIEQMEKGVLPWRRPWSESVNSVVIGSMRHSATRWPSNVRAPKVPFGVFNGTMLLAQASKGGYRSNLWVASRVVKELSASLVEYDSQPVAIQRYRDEYSPFSGSLVGVRLVYNIDQVKDCEKTLGLTILEGKGPTGKKRYERSQKLLENLVERYSLKIIRDNRAAYSPSWDVVMMPHVNQFNVVLTDSVVDLDSVARFWATLWHEVVHWTGHPSRLNRERHRRWGDKKYAFEELIAELGAAFLCAHLGIDGELQHESYLDSWCQALSQERVQSLWTASKHATAAKDFVLSTGEMN